MMNEIYPKIIRRLQEMTPEDFIKLGYRLASEYPELFAKLTSGLDEKLIGMMKDNPETGFVQAVKYYCVEKECSLDDAKEYVESLHKRW